MSVNFNCVNILAGHGTTPGSSPVLCRLSVADGDGDRGDHKTTKDYKDSIHKDINTESERTNQHLGQDKFCYKDDDCEQANEGQQAEGKDHAANGFNVQSKNI